MQANRFQRQTQGPIVGFGLDSQGIANDVVDFDIFYGEILISRKSTHHLDGLVCTYGRFRACYLACAGTLDLVQ